jgi:hypothetical protein
LFIIRLDWSSGFFRKKLLFSDSLLGYSSIITILEFAQSVWDLAWSLVWNREEGRMHISGSLKIRDIQLLWLNGGNFRLDGGAMFGAVPNKVLWQKSYPVDAENTIPLCNAPLLAITPQNS